MWVWDEVGRGVCMLQRGAMQITLCEEIALHLYMIWDTKINEQFGVTWETQ